jgi:hypothetical protein
MMIRQRRKKGFEPVTDNSDSTATSEISPSKFFLFDYFKFAFYCILLIVPIYAIVKSAIKNDWLMVIIDALLVPVGFVHGVLLLLGYAT